MVECSAVSVSNAYLNQNQILNMLLAVNTSFWYIRMNDRGAGVMQIRLSNCACIILFSVFFQGQVVTIADQDPFRTGPIKLKRQGFLCVQSII